LVTCQAPPSTLLPSLLPLHNEGVEEQQVDIVLDDDVPEWTGDLYSVMEDVALGPQQAAGIPTATQMTQPLPWIPVVVSTNEFITVSARYLDRRLQRQLLSIL